MKCTTLIVATDQWWARAARVFGQIDCVRGHPHEGQDLGFPSRISYCSKMVSYSFLLSVILMWLIGVHCKFVSLILKICSGDVIQRGQ